MEKYQETSTVDAVTCIDQSAKRMTNKFNSNQFSMKNMLHKPQHSVITCKFPAKFSASAPAPAYSEHIHTSSTNHPSKLLLSINYQLARYRRVEV
jgi:hypothetical protein